MLGLWFGVTLTPLVSLCFDFIRQDAYFREAYIGARRRPTSFEGSHKTPTSRWRPAAGLRPKLLILSGS